MLYNLPMPDDKDAAAVAKPTMVRGATLKDFRKKSMDSDQAAAKQRNFLAAMAYGGGGGSMTTQKNLVCPPSRTGKTWDTIDCHLHLLDFLQKASGSDSLSDRLSDSLSDGLSDGLSDRLPLPPLPKTVEWL
jgi:hypothetical protein